MRVLTGKPEGGKFGRSGGENGLWGSVGCGVGDLDMNSFGRGEDLWGK